MTSWPRARAAPQPALGRALGLWFAHPAEFRQLMAGSMGADYSWARPGQDYLNIYDYIRHKWPGPGSSLMAILPGYPDGLPSLLGPGAADRRGHRGGPGRPLTRGRPDTASVRATFATALHMHQPFIPTCGEGDLRLAGLISNLEQLPGHGLCPSLDLTLQAVAARR